jgi:cytoskeleton protein RodZ
MLRAAREAKGLHLAVLSVALKVPTRQLEALENDQHDAFKGTIFVRALAQAVCRHLGVDPAPVLAGLPKAASPLSVSAGASPAVAPSVTVKWGGGRARGHGVPKGVSRWVLWLAVLMLVAAASLIWWPQGQEEAPAGKVPAEPVSMEPPPVAQPEAQASEAAPSSAPSAAPVAPAPAAPDKPMAPVAVPVAAAAPVAAQVPAQTSVQGMPSANEAPLLIRATADAWVSVRDSHGQIVLNRRVRSGESVKLDMSPPLFVYVGRADGIELMWRGQGVDLKPHTQNNEIRLFIKP